MNSARRGKKYFIASQLRSDEHCSNFCFIRMKAISLHFIDKIDACFSSNEYRNDFNLPKMRETYFIWKQMTLNHLIRNKIPIEFLDEFVGVGRNSGNNENS